MDFSPTVSPFLGEKGYPRGMKTTAYENLAQALKGMIRSGTYSPGDKLPSIREMSLQTKRSINTVKEAYNLLERWGDVYAIPQSGFFVEVKPGTRSGISAASHSPRRVEETQEDEYFAVMEEILNPLHVPFGCAGLRIPYSLWVSSSRWGKKSWRTAPIGTTIRRWMVSLP
jgi:DNA-binding transcriptional regulator YhcF (GntR family)